MRSELWAVPLALLSVAGCATTTAPAASPAQARAASRLPDFELTSVEGDAVRLSDHLGREVILLSFWQTWCEPCKSELPLLDKMYRAHREEGFTVFAISMDEPSTAGLVAPYVHESGFAFDVLLDPNGKAANLYNTHKSAPYTVIIGRDGAIASETSGFDASSAKALEDRIVALLAATSK